MKRGRESDHRGGECNRSLCRVREFDGESTLLFISFQLDSSLHLPLKLYSHNSDISSIPFSWLRLSVCVQCTIERLYDSFISGFRFLIPFSMWSLSLTSRSDLRMWECVYLFWISLPSSFYTSFPLLQCMHFISSSDDLISSMCVHIPSPLLLISFLCPPQPQTPSIHDDDDVWYICVWFFLASLTLLLIFNSCR